MRAIPRSAARGAAQSRAPSPRQQERAPAHHPRRANRHRLLAHLRLDDEEAPWLRGAVSRAEGNGVSEPLGVVRRRREKCDLLFELDHVCRRKALQAAGGKNGSGLPKEYKLFINTLPFSMRDPHFQGEELIELLGQDLRARSDRARSDRTASYRQLPPLQRRDGNTSSIFDALLRSTTWVPVTLVSTRSSSCSRTT